MVGDTSAVGPCDVDGDGDLDLVLARWGRNALYLNDGAGTFSDGSTRLRAGDVLTLGTACCDLDGDDDPDIVFANDGPDRIHFNLLRQLDAPLLLRVGRAYRLDCHARYGPARMVDVASCYVAAAEIRVPLPPLGTLRPDLTTLISLGSVAAPPGGVAAGRW